jgi:competence protein ComEC
VSEAPVRVVVPQRVAAGVALGLAASLAVRCTWPALALGAALAVAGSAFARPERGASLVVAAAALAALWWGSTRLTDLDRSMLLARVGWAETTLLTVTGPPRRGRFELRLPARVARFGRLAVDEPVLLELPLGRAPPQGARLEVLGELVLPRGPSKGFDEAAWLRRQGVQVVLRGDRWRLVGRRGGFAGLADRLRAWLGRSAARGLTGERRGIVEGVVLGDDAGLSDGLRRDFRTSGLYHLLRRFAFSRKVRLSRASAFVSRSLAARPRRWLRSILRAGSRGRGSWARSLR